MTNPPEDPPPPTGVRSGEPGPSAPPLLPGSLNTDTWRRDRGFVHWSFRLPTGSSPSAAMARHAGRLPGLLPGFAVLASASWTTRSAGEDAVVLERGALIDDRAIAAVFGDHPDSYVLDLELDLVLTAPDGVTEAVLPDGAQVTIELQGEELVLDLSLNADVHAEWTWGKHETNKTLARLNAPRLAAFLARIRTDLDARFHSVGSDNRRYQFQATEHGFRQRLKNADLPDILAALDVGRAVYLTDLPDDPAQYILHQQEVFIRRQAPGSLTFSTGIIFHDGSCTATDLRHETVEEPAAHDRITAMLREGFSVELR
jgi:hypothetical protein